MKKNITIALIALAAMTACHKTDVTPQSSVSATTAEKWIAVSTRDKTVTTMLRFQADSKEVLDQLDLKHTQFTLVPTPAEDFEAPDLTVPVTSDEDGFAGYSKNATLLPQNMTERLQLPKNAIKIAFPSQQKIGTFSLEVSSSAASIDQAVARLTARFYYGEVSKVKVANLSTRVIQTYFYYFSSGWQYSGKHFSLGYQQAAIYYNCVRWVGVEVDYPRVHRYRVTWLVHCP